MIDPQLIRSVPDLVAVAAGESRGGNERCFFCGAVCDGTYPVSRFVKDSFTGWSSVATPASQSVCVGCSLCFRDAADFIQIDGTPRSLAKNAIRSFSWVVTSASFRAASPAHMDLIRQVCLDPPSPPYAIVLSVSGQTHQLYRGLLVNDPKMAGVTLEGEPIRYHAHDLRSRLDLATRICAATGKPALALPINSTSATRIIQRRPDGVTDLEEWLAVRLFPLSRLAAWLCPTKETAERDYPAFAAA